EKVRLFVAIRPPDGVKEELGGVQRELRDVLPKGSTAWTKPDSMHVTLRFMGQVASGKAAEVIEKTGRALKGFGAIDLICERLGCFPDLRFPRVVWAWVHDGGERLSVLQRVVDGTVSKFAEKPSEKSFTGHITLGRPKQLKRLDPERLAEYVQK